MDKKTKLKILKITLIIVALVMLIGATVYLFPIITKLATLEGQKDFKESVGNSGFIGVLALFGLQFAQIFLPILPGEPIELLAGMCYGWFWGTVFLIISTGIISACIYFLVKMLGKNFVKFFCGEEKIEKIENSELFKNPHKIEHLMLILFLIPGVPKDILVYIGGLLPIKPARFLLIATFARFPSIISSTLAGDKIAVGDWKMSIILYVLVIIIVAIIVYFIDKKDDKKLTKEAINTIK